MPRLILALTCAALVSAGTAAAQTAAPAPAPADPGAAPPAAKAKARTPRPAQTVAVVNASSSTATQVVLSAEGKTAQITRPLAPKARATVKLPRLTGCTVSVAATFEGEGQAEVGEFDVCKEKTIRFTDE